jgi:hypothetical protein
MVFVVAAKEKSLSASGVLSNAALPRAGNYFLIDKPRHGMKD